jgi:hypothetical protein
MARISCDKIPKYNTSGLARIREIKTELRIPGVRPRDPKHGRHAPVWVAGFNRNAWLLSPVYALIWLIAAVRCFLNLIQ